MKYLIVLVTVLLTSCASSRDVCPQSDQSELCQCYRREIPRSTCQDHRGRFDRQ